MSERFNTCKDKIAYWAAQFKDQIDLLLHDRTASNAKFLQDSFAGVAITPIKSQIGYFDVASKDNDWFTGRENELEKLKRVLEFSSTSSISSPSPNNKGANRSPARVLQRSCVVFGMGGVGKTQLALRYAWASKTRYKYTFWIRAEDDASLAESYLGFGRRLGVLRGPAKDLSEDIAMVNQWLTTSEYNNPYLCQSLTSLDPDWLVVFDNVENPRYLDHYWPRCNHGSILLTAQDNALTFRTSDSIALKSLPSKASVSLLRSLLPVSICEEDATQIAAEVGGLPLLLVHLAGIMTESHYSTSDILHILRERGDETKAILHHDSNDSAAYQYVSTQSEHLQYQKPMEVVWALALKSLTEPARNVLELMSMMSPDNVPEKLFQEDLPDPDLQFLDIQDHYE